MVYLACELALLGPGILGRLQSGAVGSNPSSDFQVMTWSLEWWPWSILHGHDPFYTSAVWAPWGYSTAWMTSTPAVAVLAAPITLVAGPLAAYNVLMLAALPAAALASYALCRELTHRVVPALVGGYIYGFSPYMLGQTVSQHLNLVQIWPFPLMALVAIRYLRGSCSPRWLVASTATLGAIVLGSSLELLAFAIPVTVITLGVAYVTAAAPRRRILRLTGCLATAGTLVGLLALPFAWLTLVRRRPPLPYASEGYATDVANLVVPTTTVVGGTLDASIRLSARFVGNVGEQGGYLGLPLLLICTVAILTDRRRGVWVAGAALVASLLWSIGPYIVVAGRTVGSEPLSLARLPVLDLGLPARMAFLVALVAAVLAATWLARPRARWLRFAAGAAMVVSLWPHTGQLSSVQAIALRTRQGLPVFAWQTTVVPRAPAVVTRPLPPGQSLLVLPFGSRTPTAYWQAQSGMRFRTVGGYTPFLPVRAVGDPTISSLFAGYPGPLAIERLRVFLRRADVGRVALLPRAGRAWRQTVHDALRPPGRPSPPLSASISALGADAQAPNGTARAGRAAVAWSQWDPTCRCGRIVFSFPAGRASPPLVSSPGFEAYNPAVAVSHDGRFAASAWIEARAGNVRVGLVRTAGKRAERLRIRDFGQPVELSLAIDDTGSVTLAETVLRGPRTLLVVQRLDSRGVAVALAALSDPGAEAVSPHVVEKSPETFVVWRQLDATATSIHVATARQGRPWTPGVVLTSDSGGLGTPSLGAGPDGITLAWVDTRGRRSTPRALSLDHRGDAIARPVALGPNLSRQDVTRIAVAGDGETVVVTDAPAGGRERARVVRVEPGASTLLRLAAPGGWRTAGLPVPVVGAALLAQPVSGARGRRTLLEPLDAMQSLRFISRPPDGSLIATRNGMSTLHVGGSREAHQILMSPSRSISVRGTARVKHPVDPPGE